MAADLFATASEIKTLIEQALTTAGASVPERSYVANGEVAYDCEQLSVEVVAITPGTLSAERQGPPRPNLIPVAQLQVALIRDCAPGPDGDGNPPTPEAIEAHSQIVLRDGLALATAFLKAPALSVCKKVNVLSCTRYGPSGNVAGWVLSMKAAP